VWGCRRTKSCKTPSPTPPPVSTPSGCSSEGNFDLVVSALAVHHLDDAAKADLFARAAARLRPGGRFVLGHLVVPDDPADVVTPIDDVHDQPSTVDDQLRWLAAAGFQAEVVWARHDLCVIVADLPS
jgi:tRNA (cmo5U34)-methyltransferase